MLKELLREEADEVVEINLSPMIDCIFLLLIFFIVTTKFVQETGIAVSKPDVSQSEPLETDSILIGITEDERVFYGGTEIGLAGVRPTVQRILLAKEVAVIIQADREARHGIFARVYSEARAAGAKVVHFSTNNQPDRGSYDAD